VRAHGAGPMGPNGPIGGTAQQGGPVKGRRTRCFGLPGPGSATGRLAIIYPGVIHSPEAKRVGGGRADRSAVSYSMAAAGRGAEPAAAAWLKVAPPDPSLDRSGRSARPRGGLGLGGAGQDRRSAGRCPSGARLSTPARGGSQARRLRAASSGGAAGAAPAYRPGHPGSRSTLRDAAALHRPYRLGVGVGPVLARSTCEVPSFTCAEFETVESSLSNSSGRSSYPSLPWW
jgi:hypothetical protein